MSSAPIVDRIRIIPRPQDFLNRNVGSSGEVFYNRDTNSLRLYNGDDAGGYEVALLSADNTLDFANAKNKVSFDWPDLSTLNSEVDATQYRGIVAYVNSESRLYFSDGSNFVPVANFSEIGSSESGGASVDVSETAPTQPDSGNIWFNSINGRLYVYVNDGDTSQWVQPSIPIPDSFSTIAIGDSTQFTATGEDTFTLLDGPGIEISSNPENKTIIISALTPPGTSFNQDLNTSNDVIFNSVSADSFINTGIGSPNITSLSTITFNAADGVIITGSQFRLPSFDNTQRNALTPGNGDLIYNTSVDKIQAYQSGSWINLEDGTSA